MNSNQTLKDNFQADSSSFEENRADSQQIISNDTFSENVNPDVEPGLTIQNT